MPWVVGFFGVFVGWGGVDAGLMLFRPSRVLSWLAFLALLATVRGGTSFLFPTAKKKRSKENAFQPLILKCPERAVSICLGLQKNA
jgi:predicted benzoate:H+ symporter BenE